MTASEERTEIKTKTEDNKGAALTMTNKPNQKSDSNHNIM